MTTQINLINFIRVTTIQFKFAFPGTTVPETPKINLISETTVTEGTPVLKIACFAEGIPAPVVTWEEIDVR